MKKFLGRFLTVLLLFVGAMVCVANATGLTDLSFADTGGQYTIVSTAMAGIAIPAFDIGRLKAVSREAFAELQAKYKHLYVIDVVVDKGEAYQFILRRPTRDIIMALGDTNDATKRSDMIIKNLVVAGNEDNVLDDGVVFSAFMSRSAEILNDAQHFLFKA
jgi:hypothetical protein|nr:MAG TPA: hypothetical protein [Caudoviricetes sp.]